jgi:hypothetical protein
MKRSSDLSGVKEKFRTFVDQALSAQLPPTDLSLLTTPGDHLDVSPCSGNGT